MIKKRVGEIVSYISSSVKQNCNFRQEGIAKLKTLIVSSKRCYSVFELLESNIQHITLF